MISLERNAQHDVLQRIRSSFGNSSWAEALVKLSLGELKVEEVRGAANDTTRQAQLLYYEGARLPTEGNRSAAADRFKRCRATGAGCPEVALAATEVSSPEPLLTTLTRTVVRAAAFRAHHESASCLHAIALALEMLRTLSGTASGTLSTTIPHVNALAAILDGLADTAQRRALTDQLNRLMQAVGPGPAVHLASVRDMGASISTALSRPLKRFAGTGKQVDISALSPVQRAALLFGLRHLGCEALVYPSARNDYAVVFENVHCNIPAGGTSSITEVHRSQVKWVLTSEMPSSR